MAGIVSSPEGSTRLLATNEFDKSGKYRIMKGMTENQFKGTIRTLTVWKRALGIIFGIIVLTFLAIALTKLIINQP